MRLSAEGKPLLNLFHTSWSSSPHPCQFPDLCHPPGAIEKDTIVERNPHRSALDGFYGCQQSPKRHSVKQEEKHTLTDLFFSPRCPAAAQADRQKEAQTETHKIPRACRPPTQQPPSVCPSNPPGLTGLSNRTSEGESLRRLHRATAQQTR